MKKLVTLLFALIGVFAVGAHAQTSHSVALRPSGYTPTAPKNVFLMGPQYAKPFSNNSVQTTYDSLSYIDSVTNPLRYAYSPGYINFSQTGGGVFLDTITSYGEHFSPPFVAYLDRIEIQVAFANLVSSSIDSINKNALTVRIKSTSAPGTKAIDTAIMTYDYLSSIDPGTDASGGHPFFTLDVPMHHKKVNRSFYVEIAPAIDFVNGTSTSNQNYFAIQQDSNYFTGNTPAAARSFGVALHGGSPTGTIPATFPYVLVDQQQNNFYLNFYIVAYITDAASGVQDVQLTGNALAQNYPNPFNPSTEIRYSVAEHGNVSLKIYNALGMEVKTLVDGTVEAGEHSVSFYGDDFPSGTYYYTLKTGNFTQTKRMVLTK
ncbi:MAG TPA: T9SS type A sorting domain-containing protein [Candidatus Kapabacteria bacterium]|nr:T9SS type A sorting domain-containing protein [Candidatus Kapabacteria bacterium]